MARVLHLAAAVVGALFLASAADAHITKIEIVAKESPTFGGYSFPAVGQYEKIVGKAFGELDPNAPGNTVIVDLELAPRNARGRVEYSFDFYILKPIDLRRGAHKVMYEPPNRGNKTHGGLNRGAAGNDPGAVTDPADLASTFLLPRGYTLVWSGWDASVEPGTRLATTLSLPVARNPDGSAITGPSYEYIVNARASYRLRYPAATTDQRSATLTHRVHLDDVPEVVPATRWTFNDAGTAISLLPAGTAFIPNDIYELSYIAKDPTVNGIGFAAVRDFNAFLRYATADEAGTPNPLAGDVTRIYSSNEYWAKGASLLHTDPQGTRDLPDHPMARVYLIASHQHGVGNAATKGNCQQFGNPLDAAPILRALWEALDRWSTKDIAPPPSMVPRFADGTLVPAMPQSAAGFPRIPGVTYTGLKSTRYLLNYGAGFYETGIMSINPPVITPPMFDNPKNGPIYPTYVPKTDGDGNEIAGIRLPDVAVPLATYTGWALRAGTHANDGCEGAGQMIPFPKTKAERLAAGDPRLSIEERYPSLAAYAAKVENDVEALVARRLMLREDVRPTLDRLLKAARRDEP